MNSFVYIIILNWNGEDLILDCLKSLTKVHYNNYKILVVDNNSTDNSIRSIKKIYPDIKILELEKNYGFAEGNNKGFEYILNENADHIIFLNNDTEVEPDFLEPLISPLINNLNIGQTVPKIFYSNTDNIWYAGGKVNLWTGQIRHRGIRKNDSPKYNSKSETDYATGCCFAMRSKDFQELGGFDSSYQMYCEDVDLSFRVRSFGQSVNFIPDSKIYHKISASIGGKYSAKKISRKVRGYLKLFWRYSSAIQKFSIALTWLISIPFILFKYIYLKYFNND